MALRKLDCEQSRLRAAEESILDIKNTFYDMHLRLGAKRGIMRIRVILTTRAEGKTAPINPASERTAFEQR